MDPFSLNCCIVVTITVYAFMVHCFPIWLRDGSFVVCLVYWGPVWTSQFSIGLSVIMYVFVPHSFNYWGLVDLTSTGLDLYFLLMKVFLTVLISFQNKLLLRSHYVYKLEIDALFWFFWLWVLTVVSPVFWISCVLLKVSIEINFEKLKL